ncbi:MAG TPA: pyridine nucleotide-disulfide oxidoreductase, partial [Azospirillaceae bacterium]|nr:pyridine nucleotide-disulfide oxidoreductase [Azospirillaceae bacterium]
MTDAVLGYDISFDDLYVQEGLSRLDRRFLDRLAGADQELANRLLAARSRPDALEPKAESDLLISLAPHVEDFLAGLFGIRAELDALIARHQKLEPLYVAKRLFVQRRASKGIKAEEAAGFDGAALTAEMTALIGADFDEVAFAHAVNNWTGKEDENADKLAVALRYAAWALHAPEGRARHGDGVLFQVPAKLDFEKLVPVETVEIGGVTMMRLPEHDRRQREGFDLTDPGTDLKGALDETNYCIWCHNQGRDSCSKGLKDRKTNAWRKSHFGVTLTGCPLEEKISEFHALKTQAVPVGALAMIAVDNPLCAATGHRICNDCMKACIYQNQKPVDIPQAETRTLKDILELPFGFEIYSLLTRWNPLDIRRPMPKP